VWRFVIFLAVAAVTFVYLAANRYRATPDAWRRIAAVEMPGCAELKSLDKLIEYLDQDDKVAYERGLKEAMLNGQCILFTSGQEVYVMDSARSKVKLRVRGDTSEYWASRRALSESQGK